MDVSWKPSVPPGHTTFSWGRRRAAAASTATTKEEKKQPEKKRGVKLPMEGKRNILITSALPYVNNVPHLGNLIGCVLSADVYSRFCRLRGHNSVYVCGTDEYGTATERKALQAKMTPRQICDKYHAIHKQVYDWFNIDFDMWGRTTTEHQTRITQEIFNDVDAKGFMGSKTTEQLYCTTCEQFLADRFVKGTCPACNSDDATGDQCDSCGATYDAHELINPKCTLCEKTPTIRSSNHLFLSLDDITPQLRAFVDESAAKGGWSENSTRIAEAWLKEGLRPRCITRDLKWGTPVPKEGFTDKVFYVWFDAPIGYISMTAAYTPEWRQWWQNPKNVELAQFMGKDNVPFHTVMFPSTLIATGRPWTLLHRISTTEYLNYEESKFSKSKGSGVFGDNAKDTGIPPAVFRYYLLASRPETADTQFKWVDLAARNNNELLKNLGNYINRSLSFAHKYFDGIAPPISDLAEEDTKFITEVGALVGKYIDNLELIQIKAGLACMMEVSRLGNGYLQSTQPWVLMKKEETKARGASVVHLALSLVYLLGALTVPYMPSTAANIFNQLNVECKEDILATSQVTAEEKHDFTFDPLLLPTGHKLNPPALLFTQIPKEKCEEWKRMFGGEAYLKSLEKGEPFPLYLAVGTIVSAESHPTSEKMYLLQVKMVEGEVPEEKKEEKKEMKKQKGKRGKKAKASTAPDLPPMRQIVSSLVGQYTAEQLVGKKVVVLCNANTRTIQGSASQGVILTAITKIDNAKVFRLLTVDKPNGTVVLPEGYSYQHVPNVNPKKVFGKLKLRTGAQGEATSAKVTWKCDGENVVSEDALANAAIA